MNCEWCYVTFGSDAVEKDVVLSIVDRLHSLGFDSVTFGGGDPFQYKFISSILNRASELNLFVHVDTHTKGLTETISNACLIENHIDLIGIPLDASYPDLHDKVRDSEGHYNLILKRLAWLKTLNINVKVNTFVSALNVENLPLLAEVILEYMPARWSIYQYWPVGPAEGVVSRHFLSEAKFSEYIGKLDIEKFKGGTSVEINSAESRRKTYPIINSDGKVYVHTEHPQNNFNLLGSVFDKDILMKIENACGEERYQARSRYKKV
jgi:MoaA/NifB/PqqE/SkfB family radical SAM enzyme